MGVWYNPVGSSMVQYIRLMVEVCKGVYSTARYMYIGKAVPQHATKAHGIVDSLFNLSTRWVSSQPHVPLTLLLGKGPQYPPNRRLGGPQRWFGGFGGKKNLLPPSGLEKSQFHGDPAHSLVTIVTNLTYIFYTHTHTRAYEHTILKNWNGIIIICNHVLPLMTCCLYNLQVFTIPASRCQTWRRES